jgi:serine protease AprX
MDRARRFIGLCLILVIAATAQAGDTQRYWVYFRDKGIPADQELAALQHVENSLTPRNLARRQKSMPQIVDEYDLPLCSEYVNEVVTSGAGVRCGSKWLNAVSVEANATQLERIRNLRAVRSVEPFRLTLTAEVPPPRQPMQVLDDPNYGLSLTQNEICHVPELHALGYTGHGVMICFLDTGYQLAHRAFQQMNVLHTFDFIHGDTIVHDRAGLDSLGQQNHGTATLSACGGFRDSVLVGPAYGALFLLAKTEIVPVEIRVEEDNYVAALEWADSLGADITSSSLGYIAWYTFSDLDGHTAVTTRGLEVAATHGILCVTAAGNERGSDWGHIVTPADADSILAVGAVDDSLAIAAFSSPGPTFDGRIKPDVCAPGVTVFCAMADSNDGYWYLGGTSLATPLVSGLAALVMEAHPDWTAQQVRAAIRNTASTASDPNNDFGWGIVNGLAAINYDVSARPHSTPLPRSRILLSAFPNPVNGTAVITLQLPMEQEGRLVLYDLLGREAMVWPQRNWIAGENRVTLGTGWIPSGEYFARFVGSSGDAAKRIVIVK